MALMISVYSKRQLPTGMVTIAYKVTSDCTTPATSKSLVEPVTDQEAEVMRMDALDHEVLGGSDGRSQSQL